MAGFLPTAISTVGSALGIPNLGIAQDFAGSQTPVQPAFGLKVDPSLAASQTSNGSNFSGQTAYPNPQASQVQGAATQQTQAPSGGSGGSSGGGSSAPITGDAQAKAAGYSDLASYNLAQAIASQGTAAQGQSQAAMQQAMDTYNNLKSQLEGQKTDITNAYNTGNQNIQNALQQNVDQAGTQTGLLNNQAQQGQNQAYLNYQNLLGQNYGLARAYGINGSGFGQLVNQSGQNYGNTQAGIQNDLGTKLNDIQNTLSSAKQQAQTQVSSLTDNYNSSMRQIALNENQSDMSKADAITKIQADYQSQVANINQAVLQMQTGFAQQAAQTMGMLATYGQQAGPAGQYLQQASNMFSSIPTVQAAQGGTTTPGTSGGIDWSKYMQPQASTN